jgi:tol-pal system protein YbgF
MRLHIIAIVGCALWASGCVTVAEHRKLEREVAQMRRGGSGSVERVADLRAQLDEIESRLARLEGRVDETQREAGRALDEVRRSRRQAQPEAPGAALPGAGPTESSEHASVAPTEASPPPVEAARTTPTEAVPPAGEEEGIESGGSVQEVSAYRDAHGTYRDGDHDACIDRFRAFLQTYPTSPYADDAAYWMAECHFKKGDYKSAILRFDDVVARYPEGDKSADALFRQGEALLKLGPNYSKAAGKAFERVVAEYPSSPRAAEAKKQLELLDTSG